MSNRTSNQMGTLVRELRVMARGLADVADEADEHSEVKLLLAASTLLNAQQDEIERLRAALEQCNEHRDDPHKIIGIVDTALAGMPPYDFKRTADETTERFVRLSDVKRVFSKVWGGEGDSPERVFEIIESMLRNDVFLPSEKQT